MTISEDASTLTLEDLPELLKDDVSVKVAGCDIDGVLRGKLMSKKKFLSVAKGGFGFCSVIFGWDMHDQTYFRELKVSNAENGYRDIIAEIDLSSFRRIPWEDNVPFFLVSFMNPDGGSLSACPRSLLARATAKIEKAGMSALAGGTSNDSTDKHSTNESQPSMSSTNSEHQMNQIDPSLSATRPPQRASCRTTQPTISPRSQKACLATA